MSSESGKLDQIKEWIWDTYSILLTIACEKKLSKTYFEVFEVSWMICN